MMPEIVFDFSLTYVGFAIISLILLVSAVRVVTASNLVHGVLWLGLTLMATALLFLLLRSPFLAGVQILLYTGGVITLMLFGVMTTHRAKTLAIVNESEGQAKGVIVALGIFAVMASAILNTKGLPEAPTKALSTELVGKAFLTQHLLAFELLSVLLLVVMVGAIVLARKKDFLPDGPQAPEAGPPPHSKKATS